MEDHRLDVPKATAGDAAHAAFSHGLSRLVPVVGPEIAEFFKLVVQSPLQKRTANFYEAIVRRIESLEQNKIDRESLQNDEEFTDVVVQASRIAITTFQTEKIEALQNAVLNTADGIDILFAEKMIFLNFVDRFSEWHLRILSLFNDPKGFFSPPGTNPFESRRINMESMLLKAYPDLRDRRQLYNFIWDELVQSKLLSEIRIQEMLSSDGWDSPRTTPFGMKFIRFISESE